MAERNLKVLDPRRLIVALLLCWAADVSAQSRYSVSESLRPIVTPALVWRFDAGASITTQSAGPALVSLPRLTATVGVPGIGIPWRGLEFSTTLADFVVAPSPPAVGYAPQFLLKQMLLPSLTRAVVAESREPVELALGLRAGVDPVLGLPWRFDGSLQILLRAPSVLRVDLTPALGYQSGHGRFDLPLRVLIQPKAGFYVAALSGVTIFDLRYTSSTAIPLGAQVGLTVPGDFGSLLDFIVDAVFPQLLVPGNEAQTVQTEPFRVMATVRFYSFWDLDATDPERVNRHDERCKRCGCEP